MEVILGLLGVSAALTDLQTGKIYNILVFPAMSAGILLRISSGGIRSVPEICISLVLPAVLFLPVWHFAGHRFAAGDVKLLLAVSCLMHPNTYLIFLFCSFLTGSCMGLVRAVSAHDIHAGIPFAVPIGVAVLFHLGGLY